MALATRALKNVDLHRDGPPPSPGQVVQYLIEQLEVPPDEAASLLGPAPGGMNDIVRDMRPVSTDSARRLADIFGTSAKFWLTLQHVWDLWPALQRVAEECAPTTADERGASRYERALTRLRPDECRAVVGRIEDGLPYDTLAADLDLPNAEAARSAVSLALVRLAAIMADLEEEGT